MAVVIHPSAIVEEGAVLGQDVEIGPWCRVGSEVRLGDRCKLASHVILEGPTIIGSDNIFYPFVSVGQRSQDLKYLGEPTHLLIGDANTFREFVTVHRATSKGGVTRIGSHCHFLAYSHIAHDCIVGNHVILSNNGTLAGHVVVHDHAGLGGLTAVHQFCRLGTHAFTGGCSKIVQDVPPFMIADGNPASIPGINKTGLERKGFTLETIHAIHEAHRILYRGGLNTSQAIARLETEFPNVPEIATLIDFIKNSTRGIIRRSQSGA